MDEQLHRAYNDEIYRHVPRAQPLHAWSSVSTVDGTVRWGEEEVEMSMDDQDETEPIAGFSRSPVRPPSDPTALYPTPRTAPRPSGSRSRQRAVPPVPGTPTSGPRLSRTGTGQAATLMDVDHGDDQDDEYEHDGMLINRRINWEGLDNEAGIPKCNHTVSICFLLNCVVMFILFPIA
ncbi:hypothetical protein BC835DRAFT_812069 [Cytidiella melzeri]|nr:hypothetical protein BC835DRAFT_812069 [Cytidiella melzeri]